jgi:Mn-dependent DtxR family transcriptional regulator
VEPASAIEFGFTATKGEYLVFIYAYTRVRGWPPAEADMQRHFKVTAPSVHQTVLTLEKSGLVNARLGYHAASKY